MDELPQFHFTYTEVSNVQKPVMLLNMNTVPIYDAINGNPLEAQQSATGAG